MKSFVKKIESLAAKNPLLDELQKARNIVLRVSKDKSLSPRSAFVLTRIEHDLQIVLKEMDQRKGINELAKKYEIEAGPKGGAGGHSPEQEFIDDLMNAKFSDIIDNLEAGSLVGWVKGRKLTDPKLKTLWEAFHKANMDLYKYVATKYEDYWTD